MVLFDWGQMKTSLKESWKSVKKVRQAVKEEWKTAFRVSKRILVKSGLRALPGGRALAQAYDLREKQGGKLTPAQEAVIRKEIIKERSEGIWTGVKKDFKANLDDTLKGVKEIGNATHQTKHMALNEAENIVSRSVALNIPSQKKALKESKEKSGRSSHHTGLGGSLFLSTLNKVEKNEYFSRLAKKVESNLAQEEGLKSHLRHAGEKKISNEAYESPLTTCEENKSIRPEGSR